MQGFLFIIGMIICYMVGRAIISAMGLIMFDTIAGLIIKPMVIGFFALAIGLGTLLLFLKALLWLAPFILIIGLLVVIVRAVRKY